ncbi:hypothetical protein [Blastococcus sp. TF02A-35]|uniref:hypothetical protein n=1 Tax=Blastococcus sp. TF02A-35 TaxID=2559612 RepID=UPI001ADD7B21|nr:hypothetical protein [Blastococcus sp. TF02A_35]
MPAPDAFAALARSSPWRWSTLRFTVSWPQNPHRPEAVRAWVRRPDLLRVESAGGELLRAERTRPQTVAGYGPRGGSVHVMTWASQSPPPPLRPDGLVDVRPENPLLSYDDPMHNSYDWVAMLDPAELADGRDQDTWDRAPAVAARSVTEVRHAGRPAWEAVVVPTATYEPRCGCCPLLRTREVDRREWDGDHLLDRYADAYRVRLDVQTGVCVLTEELGGERPGFGHDLRIEAVDEPMADRLFQ